MHDFSSPGTIRITYKYFELFDCVQMNEYSTIELLVLNSNTCNHFNISQK